MQRIVFIGPGPSNREQASAQCPGAIAHPRLGSAAERCRTTGYSKHARLENCISDHQSISTENPLCFGGGCKAVIQRCAAELSMRGLSHHIVRSSRRTLQCSGVSRIPCSRGREKLSASGKIYTSRNQSMGPSIPPGKISACLRVVPQVRKGWGPSGSISMIAGGHSSSLVCRCMRCGFVEGRT